MGDDVHGRIRAHRPGNRVQVVGEGFDAVRGHSARTVAAAEPAGVVCDDPDVVGELCGDLCPHVMGVGPAVHEQDRRTVVEAG